MYRLKFRVWTILASQTKMCTFYAGSCIYLSNFKCQTPQVFEKTYSAQVYRHNTGYRLKTMQMFYNHYAPKDIKIQSSVFTL